MSMFDGFIKPTIDTDINTNIDMSAEHKTEHHHYHGPNFLGSVGAVIVVRDDEKAAEIAKQFPSVAIVQLPAEPETP